MGVSNEDLGAQNQSTGDKTLQKLHGKLRQLAPMLERVVGALIAIQHLIASDQMIRVDSTTVRHVGKVDNVLDVFKGVLVGMSVEKLCMTISHAKTEK